MKADALSRIRARGPIGIRLGLARMRALLAALGDPQDQLHGALIAGTNGKGSVAAMVASILTTAGYSTGQSPSPHLHSYRERITVDGRPIPVPDFDPLLEEVLTASEPGEADHGPATEFELFTAASYLWSARRRVDIMVMEVGLGGRLDASNAWDADVAVVTNVGLDHQAFLGDTVALVAAEKAAIIKPGGRAVTGASGEALAVVETQAQRCGVPLTIHRPLPVLDMDVSGLTLDGGGLGPLELPLLGRHQAANAAVALGVVDAFAAAGLATVTADAIRVGLAATRWPGRLELRTIAGQTVLLDGAHNPDGVSVLVATLEELAAALPSGPATLLVGMMADKEIEAMLGILARSPRLDDARLVAAGVPETERGAPAATLAEAWLRASGRPPAAHADDHEVALERALAIARESGGPLIVAGSLYLLGPVRARLLPDEVPDR